MRPLDAGVVEQAARNRLARIALVLELVEEESALSPDVRARCKIALAAVKELAGDIRQLRAMSVQQPGASRRVDRRATS